MKIKTSGATGQALDWLVAKAEGGFDLHQRLDWHNKPWAFFFRDDEDPERVDKFYVSEYEPSTDWSQGGPIIEREKIDIGFSDAMPSHSKVSAAMRNHDDDAFEQDGPTPLIAAMRCYVASKLGEEVDVPEELK